MDDAMPGEINVLDVSLRDGGHRINFAFSQESLAVILTSLDKAGIRYIEVGYRNGYDASSKRLGVSGICPAEYLNFCRASVENAKIAAMVHPQNVTDADLREMKDCGVDLLRICVARGKVDEACVIIQKGHDAGLDISVNLIHISNYSQEELDAALKCVVPYQPEMIYFADSNGSLFPNKIETIYKHCIKKYSMPFGFHAHDNLGLAQANALAAIRGGATYIDASLSGMGKGTGNLKTEFFSAYLYAMNHKQYHLQPILFAANYVREHLKIGHESVEMDEFIRGISDLSTAKLKHIQESGQYDLVLPN